MSLYFLNIYQRLFYFPWFIALFICSKQYLACSLPSGSLLRFDAVFACWHRIFASDKRPFRNKISALFAWYIPESINSGYGLAKSIASSILYKAPSKSFNCVKWNKWYKWKWKWDCNWIEFFNVYWSYILRANRPQQDHSRYLHNLDLYGRVFEGKHHVQFSIWWLLQRICRVSEEIFHS